MSAVRTDAAQAIASAALDSYSEMLATMREQARHRNDRGYAYAVHDRGAVQLGPHGTVLLSIAGSGYNVGIHDWTSRNLRSLAAASIAIADALDAEVGS